MKTLFILVAVIVAVMFCATANADWVDQIIEHQKELKGPDSKESWVKGLDLRGKWDEHGKLLLMAIGKDKKCWEYIAVKQDDPNYDYDNEYTIIILRKCGSKDWIEWKNR
jgi:hypothetical protein